MHMQNKYTYQPRSAQVGLPGQKLLAIGQFSALLDYPITRQQILDSSKLKELAADNFKFDENGRKLSLQAISPFPTVFSKGLCPRGVKRCHCVGMGYSV